MNSDFSDDRIDFGATKSMKRWFILFILSWLNFTNGLIWISYASISDHVSSFYNVSLDTVNYLSLVFPVVTIVLGLPVIWGMDKVGLRVTCVACGWLNLVASLFRLASSDRFVTVPYRIFLAMSGQIVGAMAQPLAMFSPARLAALWFPPDQRALATTIGAMGNPLGVLIGSVVPPYLVIFGPQSHGLFHIAIGILVISLVSALLPTLGIYRSAPVVSPAISNDRQQRQQHQTDSFRNQLCLCATSMAFVKLALAFGVGLGLFTALSTLFEQIFCPFGYSDNFAGMCGGILIGAGVVGSFVSGVVADRTKAFVEIVQACLVSATFGTIAFSVLASYSNIQIPIAFSVAWVGASGVAVYSVALELAAEITFPVSENVSTGLLVVAGQIFSVLFIVLSQYLWQPMTDSTVVMICLSDGGSGTSNSTSYGTNVSRDYWPFNVFISCTAIVASCLMLIDALSPRYQRRLMESVHASTHESYGTDVEASLTH